MNEAKGSVEHERIIKDGLQSDVLTTRIPLECVNADGLRLLDYWCVEDFDYAYINREDGEYILVCEIQHYLPDGYEEVGQ